MLSPCDEAENTAEEFESHLPLHSCWRADKEKIKCYQVQTENDTSMLPRLLNFSGIILGIAFGVFVQICWLGIIFLTLVINESSLLASEPVTIGLFWSVATSLVSAAAIYELRNFVSRDYNGTNEALGKMLFQMETRFIVGEIVGSISAWTITDVDVFVAIPCFLSLSFIIIVGIVCRYTVSYIIARKDERFLLTKSAGVGFV
jgi:hypothetical protein